MVLRRAEKSYASQNKKRLPEGRRWVWLTARPLLKTVRQERWPSAFLVENIFRLIDELIHGFDKIVVGCRRCEVDAGIFQ